jgi:hypothetical protein
MEDISYWVCHNSMVYCLNGTLIFFKIMVIVFIIFINLLMGVGPFIEDIIDIFFNLFSVCLFLMVIPLVLVVFFYYMYSISQSRFM